MPYIPPTSEAIRRFANARATSDALIPLLTITHPTFDQPARIAANTSDVISRGMRFVSLGFELIWPKVDGKSVPMWGVRIDSTDPDIRRKCQAATSPPGVTLEAVLASAPDTLEIQVTGLVLRNVTWDDVTLTGQLILDDATQQILPGHSYDPVQFAGIF